MGAFAIAFRRLRRLAKKTSDEVHGWLVLSSDSTWGANDGVSKYDETTQAKKWRSAGTRVRRAGATNACRYMYVQSMSVRTARPSSHRGDADHHDSWTTPLALFCALHGVRPDTRAEQRRRSHNCDEWHACILALLAFRTETLAISRIRKHVQCDH